MGNDVSKVVNTAAHVQKVVNSVINPGVANIVGSVAGKDAAAVTKAIGETVSPLHRWMGQHRLLKTRLAILHFY